MVVPTNKRPKILKNTVFIFLFLVAHQLENLAANQLKIKSGRYKNVKPFVVNSNSPYYKEHFSPCKETRDMNPVETVKARNWATQVFGRCGPKLIVHYATKWNVPAFAIQAVGDRFCLGATLIYAIQSIDNGTIISKAMVGNPGVLFEPIEKMLRIMIEQNYTKVVTQGTRHYDIEGLCFIDFLQSVIKCVTELGRLPPDLDYIKHAINYYRFILL